jgi:hypothetical protein
MYNWVTNSVEKFNIHSAHQEIPHFYGTRRFITVTTRARHINYMPHKIPRCLIDKFYSIISQNGDRFLEEKTVIEN